MTIYYRQRPMQMMLAGRRNLKAWLAGLAWFAAHPTGRMRMDWTDSGDGEGLTALEFKRAFYAAMDRTINAKVRLHLSRGRKDCPDQLWRWRQDQEIIRARALNRPCPWGRVPLTPEVRERFPDLVQGHA